MIVTDCVIVGRFYVKLANYFRSSNQLSFFYIRLLQTLRKYFLHNFQKVKSMFRNLFQIDINR